LATLAILVAGYVVVEAAKDTVDAKTATVTVSWVPKNSPVRIIVRVAMRDRVAAKTFVGSPFSETYAVKRGDQVLVVTDPMSIEVGTINCSIAITGQAPKTNAGTGHIVCLGSVT
jgi:hypothetical protein